MDMSAESLQTQYNNIYSYFKTTTEPLDHLEWDGHTLKVWNGDVVVETYDYGYLRTLIPGL